MPILSCLYKSMQIDYRNFQEHVELVLQQIATAHFVALDCEFTGLVTQLTQIEGMFPDHREFYERIKQTSVNFNLLQLGITLFHFEDGEYYPRSYNFYVSGADRPGYNKVIVSEWDSMAFLARNGMDFAQAFRYGIEYKRIYGEKVKTQRIDSLSPQQYGSQKVFFSPSDKETIEKIERVIEKEKQFRMDFKSKRIFDYFRSKYDLSFEKSKANMQKFEYSIKIYPREDNGIQFEEKPQDNPFFPQKVQEISYETKEVHSPLTLESVIAKIIQCGKPIVGHYPSLDLGLIYHSFIAELPPTFEEFTNHLNQLFPYIFDTKVISRRLQSRMKSIKVDLKSLYKACSVKKLLQPYSNINYKHVEAYLKQDSSHEAGFDSFMTGCAFIGMLNCIYETKEHPFVFANAHVQNKILYSKFAGEISLVGPVFSEKTQNYDSKIIIAPSLKSEFDWQSVGNMLSQFGTIAVYEDHDQTYYFFDEDQNIGEILKTNEKLKPYSQRHIIKCRTFFTSH